jgi:hypothetical protein
MAICLALRQVACTDNPSGGGGKAATGAGGKTSGKAAGTSAAASSETSTAKSTAPSPKPLLEGWEKPAVAILFSGEMHGYIEPCGCSLHQLGGLSRRADLMRQLAERGWPLTALDVGGLVNNPTRRQGKFKCDMVLKCLTDMKYGAVAVGVEELQLGLDFINFQKPDELPLLSANVIFFEDRDFTGGPVPARTIEAGGVKIGVTAAFDPELDDLVRPGGQNPGGLEYKILDPIEEIKKQLAALQAAKPDLLVLLWHGKYAATEKLAAQFPKFDIIVTAGGAEDPDPKPKFIGKKTLLVAPGQKGKHVPVAGFYPAGGKDRVRFDVIDLDDRRFANSPKVLEHMRFYQDDMLKANNLCKNEPAIDDLRNLDPLTGRPVEAQRNPFMGAKVCGECHKSAYDVWTASKHAQATEAIKTGRPEEAKAFINRIYDPECIACHVTGWDPKQFVRFKTGYEDEETTPHLVGQSCENCHGPGGRHTELERAWAKDKKTTDEVTAWRKFHRRSVKTARDLCVRCHDGDNDPEFDTDKKPFDKYWAEIAHPGKD